MSRTPALPLALVAVAAMTGCPTVVSLECATCRSDEQCAPQGLQCIGGRCEGATACVVEGDAGGGDAGARDAGGGDAGAGDAGGGDAGGGDGGSGDAGRDASVPRLPPLGVVPDASTVFADDFENEPVLTRDGGGQWDRTEHDEVVGQSLFVSLDAGRGGAGLVLLDTDGSNGGVSIGRLVSRDFAPQTGDLYVRAHVWLKTAQGPTGPVPVATYSDNVADFVAAEFGVFGGAALKSGDAVSSLSCDPVVDFTESRWHVVELVLLKLGVPKVGSVAQGVAALRLDGQLTCAFSRDWSTAAVTTVALGSSSMDPAWLGELRLDNLALTSGGPSPTRLVLTPPDVLPAGTCLPVRVELRDGVDGGLARAVRPVRLALDAGASGAVFGPDCSAATASVIAAGEASVVVGLRAQDAGPRTVSAVDVGVDLEGDSATWVVAPSSL